MTTTLMVQGTTSDSGKSTLVAGLCRVLLRRGISVVPFKPQNMALNSAVTCDGGEIGRAQAVQAQAAGLEPHTDMNPVLLKPNSDVGAQVIVHGHAVSDMNATSYHRYKCIAMSAVLESYDRLSKQFETVLVEGAGSPAEINLRERDIANMGFAEAVDCPVLLIADIDRGGVFAHLVGTLELLSPSEQRRVKGFVINRFRGDLSMLQSGLEWLERHTGKPVLGVLPYLHGLHLEAEDALTTSTTAKEKNSVTIVVPALPHISNHTDFDPLRHHPQVNLLFSGPGEEPPPADLLILPGSKNVRSDLAWLGEGCWKQYIHRHLRYGGKLIGICGGFQMLGKTIHDPDGLEGRAGSNDALALLDMESTLMREKQLHNRKGALFINDVPVSGYEIHMGISSGQALNRPAVSFSDGQYDGAVSEDDQILGTYLHGLFEQAEACQQILNWAGLKESRQSDYLALREANIERLADTLEEHIDLQQLFQLL